MAKPEWGTKRQCQACGAKYYDFGRSPITCPACGVAFDPEAILKARRPRPSAVKKDRVVPVAGDEPEDQVEEESVAEADEEEDVADEDAVEGEDAELDEDLGDDDEDSLLEDASELGEDDDDVDDIVEGGEEEER